MHNPLLSVALLLATATTTTTVVASPFSPFSPPSPPSPKLPHHNHNQNHYESIPIRPPINPSPHNTGLLHPPSPPRNRTCLVSPSTYPTANETESDDVPAILAAFQSCNPHGTVLLPDSYTISSPLNISGLRHVDVFLSGEVKLGNTVEYWAENAFQFGFQNMTGAWMFHDGVDVNLFGYEYGGEGEQEVDEEEKGLIDGQGQKFWDAFAEDPALQRPIMLTFDGVKGGSVVGLRMKDSPNWFNLIANSTSIYVSDMSLSAVSSDPDNVPVKNSDGWDTYRSSHVVIQNSVIENTDDCVSFKPNSTDVVVQGLRCHGSHGISVGSLGQYPDQFDIVENILVYDNFMSDASDAARIKVWPGISSDFQPGLAGGGGAGYVRNVTYERYESENNDWAIEVNQCYGQSNQTLCELHPSNMTISDIYFIDMWGTTSESNDPNVGTLVCSSPEQCYNFYAKNVSITAPSGASQWICSNFDTSGLEGFECVDE